MMTCRQATIENESFRDEAEGAGMAGGLKRGALRGVASSSPPRDGMYTRECLRECRDIVTVGELLTDVD